MRSGTGPVAAALLAVVIAGGGCTEPEAFPPRTRVGLLPDGFVVQPVSSSADAAAYVDAYTEALGVDGVRAVQALEAEGGYWVYVSETGADRAAFALEVFPDGEMRLKRFPAMEPEMMWNQKYGHRARPDPTAIAEPVSATGAERRLQEVLPENEGLRLGPPSDYYGYFLFPLCQGSRFVGEGAVNADDGEVVWERLSAEPQRIWTAPGVDGTPCD